MTLRVWVNQIWKVYSFERVGEFVGFMSHLKAFILKSNWNIFSVSFEHIFSA